ncbi:MAG: carboxymuconolactone decarboxylase family protein [Xenococcus sp. (in: cyanobacteria)]
MTPVPCGNPCPSPIVEKEITEALCFVPSFFKTYPDDTLSFEWDLFRRFEFDPVIKPSYKQSSPPVIPLKYRQLIGLAVHAETKCPYCIPFHTELAKLFGATDAEVQEALHYAKHTVGVSAYINGLQPNLDEFKAELAKIVRCLSQKLPPRPQTEAEERCH